MHDGEMFPTAAYLLNLILKFAKKNYFQFLTDFACMLKKQKCHGHQQY